jgi:hypothetical protein
LSALRAAWVRRARSRNRLLIMTARRCLGVALDLVSAFDAEGSVGSPLLLGVSGAPEASQRCIDDRRFDELDGAPWALVNRFVAGLVW